MNNLLKSQASASTWNIPNGNVDPYVSEIYKKQLKFYYKYLEFLSVTDTDLERLVSGDTDDDNKGRVQYKYTFKEGNDGFNKKPNKKFLKVFQISQKPKK